MSIATAYDNLVDFEYCIARQPVCDRDLKLVAYELLYRSNNLAISAEFPDPDQATAQVLMTALTEAGMEFLTGDVLGYVNMTREALLNMENLDLPCDHIVLEILEDVVIDEHLLSIIRRLAGQGYLIALDDFVYKDSLKALVELAHIIKLDVRALDQQELIEQVQILKEYPVKLLAEKVETWEEFRFCKALGFDLFQGYFFSSPQLLSGKKAPHNRLSTLKLIARLNEEEVQFEELVQLIAQDPFLYYKLLRYINSAALGSQKKFSNINQVVIFLGIDRLRILASMLSLTKMSDKPALLFSAVLQRARFCELLAQEMNISNQEEYFTAGLFSMLDACLDMPLDQLFQDLPLPPSMKDAILKREGCAGSILNCAIKMERWECDCCLSCISNKSTVHRCYRQAIKWSDEILRDLD